MNNWHEHSTHGITWRERPGTGPVAVLLHGIGSRAFGWERLGEHLPGWRLIAWDAPGYGQSDALANEWPLAIDYADALAGFVQALNLARFHLVGHSLGTLIGAAFAGKYRDLAHSLTLASCAQGGGAAPGGALSPAHQARIDELQSQGADAFAAARAPRLIHRAQDNPALVADATRAMASVTMPGYGQAVRMLASGDLRADMAAVDLPTTVTVGAEDVVTPPKQSIGAHAALPRPAPLAILPGCGHALPLQAPEALARLIMEQAKACATPETPKKASQ